MPRPVPCFIDSTFAPRSRSLMCGVSPWRAPCWPARLRKNRVPCEVLLSFMHIYIESGGWMIKTRMIQQQQQQPCLLPNANNYDKYRPCRIWVQYGMNGTRPWWIPNIIFYGTWDLFCIGFLVRIRTNLFCIFVVLWNWTKYQRYVWCWILFCIILCMDPHHLMITCFPSVGTTCLELLQR